MLAKETKSLENPKKIKISINNIAILLKYDRPKLSAKSWIVALLNSVLKRFVGLNWRWLFRKKTDYLKRSLKYKVE